MTYYFFVSLIRQSLHRQRLPCSIATKYHHHLKQQRRYNWSVASDTGIISYNNEPRFQTVIGLEVHAQLDIPQKLFSSAPVVAPHSRHAAVAAAAAAATATAVPNTLIRPFDLAVPGVLPMTSKAAVQATILTASALQCDIAPVSRFERKHYHYADLPFGYQVTQQRWPIATNGFIQAQVQSSNKQTMKKKQKQQLFPIVRIDRIQLEQDTGKTTTSTRRIDNRDGTSTITHYSMVDFNRAGCALVEIVMHPDIRSSQHAVATVETLRQLLKHIGTCNGRMEEGSLRVDLNVSVHSIDGPEFQSNLYNRVEVKNLNSLRQVQQAADYEALRQVKIIVAEAEAATDNRKHGTVVKTFQETRTFHVKSGKTVLIRSKEGDEDYRFMPEPDLPPVVLDEALDGLSLEDFLAKNMPELPEAAKSRLQDDYNLDAYTASVIASDPPAIRIFDEAVKAANDSLIASDNTTSEVSLKDVPTTIANLLCNELFSLIREDEEERRSDEIESFDTKDVPYSTVDGQQLGEIVALQLNGTMSATMSKKLVGILYHEEHGRRPSQVAQERGLQLISDMEALRNICRDIIDLNPESLEQYKKGGKHVIKMKKFLVGKSMAHSHGNAHPERLHDALEDVLEELAPGVG